MSYQKLETPEWIEALQLEALADPRGMLIEPVDDSELRGGAILNLHVATASPGAVRGNHTHPRRTETICVLGGHFVATFRRAGSAEQFQMEIPEGRVVTFRIKPGTAHAFKNVGSTTGYLLCHADISFDPADIERTPLQT